MDKLIDFLYDDNKEHLLSDNDLAQIAQRFKILSEFSRLKILRALFDGEKSVTEIIEKTGLLQANVSKQLSILQKNKIVTCRPEGLMRYYKLSDFTIQKICHAVCGNLKN